MTDPSDEHEVSEEQRERERPERERVLYWRHQSWWSRSLAWSALASPARFGEEPEGF
jgi:hypothetical protein